MKTYPIPGPLLQAIVNYLQKRPWEEVNEMLVQISQIGREVDNPSPPPSLPSNGKGEELRP
jgi:hypothetical protein